MSTRNLWAGCVLLAVLVIAVYSPVRNYPFINYDDQEYVANNPHVRAGLSWATIAWSLTATEASNWHPLTWLSHALDCELFGLDAGWHHLTNVLLHGFNVVLFFWLLLRVTGAVGRSFVAAALFGLHPFNVGSVAWIAERKNVLSTLFLLLTLAAYGWYARKPGAGRYTLMAVLFAMGLAAKPMLVTLPFALLLLDYWPLQRVAGWSGPSEHFQLIQLPVSRLITEKVPLLALSVASSAITVIAQRNAQANAVVFPFQARLANAVSSYGMYIWKVFWPAGFAIYYPHPFSAVGSPPRVAAWAAVIAGLLLLIAASYIAWWQRSVRPYLVIGWLWYLGTLVPVIGLVQVGGQGMADRYVYVPLIGIFVVVAWGAAEVAERFHVPVPYRQGTAALVLAILGFLTLRQVGYWKTSLDLWLHTVEVTKDNYSADNEVGDLMAAEQQSEALQYYETAVRIAPRDTESRMGLARYLRDHGQLQEAIQNYEALVQISPERHPHAAGFAYTNLCMIHGELGDLEQAHEAFEQALRFDPQQIGYAIGDLKQIVANQPSADRYLDLGLLLEQSGQRSASRDAYMQTLRLNPAQIQAQRALTRLDVKTGAGTPPGSNERIIPAP